MTRSRDCRRFGEQLYWQRLAAAVAILERYCPVRFNVVAADTWTSDSSAADLQQLTAGIWPVCLKRAR